MLNFALMPLVFALDFEFLVLRPCPCHRPWSWVMFNDTGNADR